MNSTLRLFIIPALVVFAFSGCGKKEPVAPIQADSELVRIRFQTDWFPQPEHGGYYQALAKGYYAEEGIDVEILPGGPNAQMKQLVALGEADLGMTNGDDVIVAIARGLPIQMVAAEMQRDPQGILFHNSHPLRNLEGLQGRTLMAGSVSTWLDVVRKKLGVEFNQMPLVGDLARFMNDKTLVQQCFVTNEPFFARERGADVGALLIANDTYEPYRVIFAGRLFLAENPVAVEKFVQASIRGWVDYLTGDPTPGNQAIAKLRNDLSPEFMAYSIKAMNDYQLVLGDPAKNEFAGQLTAARLQKQIALLQELGLLDKPVTVEDVATFEFIPRSANP
ncbi:MAG: NitT/TauT family transport system substrate-binding protein [Verrucomicrobiota bacterium]|nr:NitT/TauT family transport system substrate-binding protein [Verrucomicrobiota bacterium]